MNIPTEMDRPQVFDELEAEFERAMRLEKQPRSRLTRLAVVAVVGIAVIGALPAVAAVTIWDETPPEPRFDTSPVPHERQPAGEPTAPAPDERARSAPRRTDTDPRLLRAFGVLRQEPREADRLPEAFLGTRLARDISDPGAARLAVRTPYDTFYVAPMAMTGARAANPSNPPWVCLFGLETGMGCNKLDSVQDGYSLLAADRMPGQRKGEVRLAGLVPDGVVSVSIQIYSDGPTYQAAVRNNVWTLVANASAQQTPVKLVQHRADGSSLSVRLK